MKINPDKSIGRVLFIVEGSRYEFTLLRKIFCDILKYEYVEKRRNTPHTFVSRNKSHSRIAVVNTEESNITDITDSSKYLDDVFEMLTAEYNFPVDRSAVYYLFDRDPKSNTDIDTIKKYIEILKDPYDNDDLRAGMLLLSYPSIEAYTISQFTDKACEINLTIGADAKEYITLHNEIQLGKMSEDTIRKAADEFIFYLESEKLSFDIDDFSRTSIKIFTRQEMQYLRGEGYRVFSMLTLAFLQLGILEM